jgi:MFS family permease
MLDAVIASEQAAGPAPPPLHRNRDFLCLWSGQAVSTLGSQVSRVAYPLLVLVLTGSAAKAALAGAAATLPYLIFPLLAGAYADRWDRRRLMIGCDVLRLLALGSVAVAALIGAITYQQVLVAGFAEGTGTVWYTVTSRGAVPMLVHPSQRTAAVSQNEARTYGAQIAGQAMGGALFGVSRFLPFAADALSYLASLGTLALIRTPMQEAASRDPVRGLWRDLGAGLRWTVRQPFLRTCSLVSAVVNLCFQVQSLAVIVLARADGAAPALIGVIVGCSGVGGLLGSFAAPALVRRIRPGLIIVGCLWLCAVCLAALCVVRGPFWLCPVMAAVGLVMGPWNVASQAYRMRITPNWMLARVSSVTFQVAWGAIPLGSLLAAVLLQSLSPAVTMGIVAALLAVTAVAATADRSMRGAGSATDPGGTTA